MRPCQDSTYQISFTQMRSVTEWNKHHIWFGCNPRNYVLRVGKDCFVESDFFNALDVILGWYFTLLRGQVKLSEKSLLFDPRQDLFTISPHLPVPTKKLGLSYKLETWLSRCSAVIASQLLRSFSIRPLHRHGQWYTRCLCNVTSIILIFLKVLVCCLYIWEQQQ